MAGAIDDNQKGIIKEAVRQFVDAQLRGEELDTDEFVKKYPGLDSKIRKGITELQKIDALFDSLVQTDESDFEEAAPERDLVGRKLGHLEIREMIGRGGMGVVYLARDTKLKRFVAIKSMPAELQADSTVRTRFNREAELLASLNHPNIAVIHDIIEEDKSGYLILEYIPGETLAERIAREPIKLKEVLSIGQQIAEAVSVAHKKGVVHRDLKPGNIKITPEGKVKVLDFGLAKTFVSEGTDIEITSTEPGHIIGTPAYMSPEQARGNPTDHRTDIWSFGCIIYQMLTSHSPFESDTTTDTLARIIERQPDWELLPQETPENIRVLLRHCLEKNQDERLGNIADAAIEIRETLSKPLIVPTSKLRRKAMIVGAVAISIILFVIALKFIPQKEIQSPVKQIRLVVLPFENIGPAEQEWFADGITDEITTRLVNLHELGVISSQSAIQYKRSKKSTQVIAEELSVDYILKGTIQVERPSDPNSQLRIRLQLIRTSDDTHVWSKIYDIRMNEVFHLQSEVAELVAQGLDITLLEPERKSLASVPTENIEAYEYYLQGNNYYNRSYLESDSRIAIRMYEKAVELDSNFALAYARLSMTHGRMYWFPYDHSKERLALAKQAVDKAFQLNPGLPEAHVALGFYHYWGHLDYDNALEQFAIARKSQPNNSSLLSGIGWVQRRQGKFEQALANLKRACETDPLSALLMEQLGETFALLRKYPEAESYFNSAIFQDPNVTVPYNHKAHLYLRWEGSTKNARTVLVEALEKVKSTETPFIDSLVTLDVYDRNYQKALDRLSLKSEDIDSVFSFIPNALRCAQIYRYMGNNQKAKEYFEQAIDILKSKIAEDPNDARFHSSLGIAYAGLGRKEDAIREGKRGFELLPVIKDAWEGLYRVEALALIYVMVGEYDLAIEQLEYLLSIPGELSIPLLRLDPAWDPLRNHPRFKKLIESGK
jgi:serine/threonine protein kinase/tetratricopeptide (TPR) repeat protein